MELPLSYLRGVQSVGCRRTTIQPQVEGKKKLVPFTLFQRGTVISESSFGITMSKKYTDEELSAIIRSLWTRINVIEEHMKMMNERTIHVVPLRTLVSSDEEN